MEQIRDCARFLVRLARVSRGFGYADVPREALLKRLGELHDRIEGWEVLHGCHLEDERTARLWSVTVDELRRMVRKATDGGTMRAVLATVVADLEPLSGVGEELAEPDYADVA